MPTAAGSITGLGNPQALTRRTPAKMEPSPEASEPSDVGSPSGRFSPYRVPAGRFPAFDLWEMDPGEPEAGSGWDLQFG